MPGVQILKAAVESSGADELFTGLYGRDSLRISTQRMRYSQILNRYQKQFPDLQDVQLFNAPGRTEVGGNHTDHNLGCVLAAAVDLDLLAVVSPSDDGWVRIFSQDYRPINVDTRQLGKKTAENGSSAALVRGVAASLVERGYTAGGFTALMISDIPSGSGLSSSAAFEVQVGTIWNVLYNQGKIDPLIIAQAGQYAENQYFGKPSGLMDQTTCAVGGFVHIDFQDPANAGVHKVNYDFGSNGYSIVIVATGGSHAHLTEDYAEIQSEMKAVAQVLGAQALRQVSKEQVLGETARLRQEAGDRAVLRALHFFDENDRVAAQVRALESGDFVGFLELVNESGRSSWMLLQNGYSVRRPRQQGIPLAQALTQTLLGSAGACRVHGGGFAGTVQVFLPEDAVENYIQAVEAVFGRGACRAVSVRSDGSAKLEVPVYG